MKALFVGGPWHGHVEVVPDGYRVLRVPVPLKVTTSIFPQPNLRPELDEVAYFRCQYWVGHPPFNRFWCFVLSGWERVDELLEDARLKAGIDGDHVHSA